MKILPITLPRTRSTYLYESLKGYQQHLGLIKLKTHSEYFLEINRNVEFHDAKTETYHSAEIVPIVANDQLGMHFVYPHLFNNTKDRNHYKLEILKSEKAKNREYYIKGTQAIAPNIAEIVDFFSDRTILLTKRANMVDNVLSAQFAWHTKHFHCRKYNHDIYMRTINEGVELDPEHFKYYFDLIKDFNEIESYLKANGVSYKTFEYERMTDKHYISDVLETDEWEKYRKPEDISTIHIEKDYSKIIRNYNECVQVIEAMLNDKSFR